MAIPDYQTLMRHALEVLSESGVAPMRDLTERISNCLNFTEDERRETITFGMSLLANRVHWSVTYLSKAKAVERPGGAECRRGRRVSR